MKTCLTSCPVTFLRCMPSTPPAENPALVWADVGCIGGGAEAEPEPSQQHGRSGRRLSEPRRNCDCKQPQRGTGGSVGRPGASPAALGRTGLPAPSPLASASAGGPGVCTAGGCSSGRRRRLLRRNGRDRRDSVTRLGRMNPGSCTTRRKLDRGWNRQSSLVLQALFAARFTGAGRRAQLSARPTAKENAPICPRHSVGANIDPTSARRSGDVDRRRVGRVAGTDRPGLRSQPEVVTNLAGSKLTNSPAALAYR